MYSRMEQLFELNVSVPQIHRHDADYHNAVGCTIPAVKILPRVRLHFRHCFVLSLQSFVYSLAVVTTNSLVMDVDSSRGRTRSQCLYRASVAIASQPRLTKHTLCSYARTAIVSIWKGQYRHAGLREPYSQM